CPIHQRLCFVPGRARRATGNGSKSNDKKLLITSVAALFLATGAARAAWDTRFPLPNIQLPEEMIGTWCLDGKTRAEEGTSYYTKRDECPDDEETLTIRPDGWDEVWDNCPFTKITKEADGVYLIYSRCEILSEGDGHGLGSYFIVNQEYQIAEN